MNGWLWALIAVVVVALVIKRFRGEPMNARDVFGPPVVLLGIGIYGLVSKPLTGVDIAWVIIASVVGFAFGVLRGTTVTIYERAGVLWQRYRLSTLGVWVASFVVGAGINVVGVAMGAHPDARPMTLTIGVSLVGEMTSLGLRALATGVPFAPDTRTTPPAGIQTERTGGRP